MNEYLLNIDVGTTNCKAFLFNTQGEIKCGSRVQTHRLFNRLGPGWVELDAELQWKAVCKAIKQCVTKANINLGEIAGVGITAMRQTVVPVNKAGNPVRYVIPWEVKATYPQAKKIRENIGLDKVYNITGLTVSPLWALPSLLYIIEQEPEVYERTYKFLEIQDFILHRLGVEEFTTDYSQASCISLLDLRKFQWSTELCNALGIPIEKLPKLVAPGEIVGKISKKAARQTGLKENTPLVIGGGDTQSSALGSGVIFSGTVNTIIGTSAVANAFLNKPFFDPSHTLVCHPHVYQGKYLLDHNTLTGGNAYRWFLNTFCKDEIRHKKRNQYKSLNESIIKCPIGANGVVFLPHFVGAASPYWNDLAQGVFVGINLMTRKSSFGRAIIEGACLELRKGLELMEKYGVKIESIRACGGVCEKGSSWNQIQSDVYGKPVFIMNTKETTALGGVILTSVALGLYTDVCAAVRKMVKISQEIRPNLKAYERYTSILAIQNKIYSALDTASVYTDLYTLQNKSDFKMD